MTIKSRLAALERALPGDPGGCTCPVKLVWSDGSPVSNPCGPDPEPRERPASGERCTVCGGIERNETIKLHWGEHNDNQDKAGGIGAALTR